MASSVNVALSSTIGPNGYAQMAWIDYGTGNLNYGYQDGTGFHTAAFTPTDLGVASLQGSSGTGNLISIAVDSNNIPHIAVGVQKTTGVTGERGVWYATYNGSGSISSAANWTFGRVATYTSPNGWLNVNFVAVAIDPTVNRPAIAWFLADSNSGRSSTLYYITRNSDGSWSSSGSAISDTGTSTAATPTGATIMYQVSGGNQDTAFCDTPFGFAIDSNGKHAFTTGFSSSGGSYYDQLLFGTDASGSWATTTLQAAASNTTNITYSATVAFDGSNNPRVAWSDQRDGSVNLETYNGSSWSHSSVAASLSPSSGYYSTLTYGYAGSLEMIAFSDSDGTSTYVRTAIRSGGSGSWTLQNAVTRTDSVGYDVCAGFLSSGTAIIGYDTGFAGNNGEVRVLTGNIAPSPPPVITSSLTASGTYGTAISTYTITATNSPASFSATGLPSGLSINTGNGQITGTPTAPGSYSVTIGATNSSGSDSKTLAFTIAKATLTISGTTANNKTYDGTTAASLDFSAASLNGVVGSDAVGVDISAVVATFASKTVGTGKTVTSSGYSLVGAQAANYTITPPTATANITARTLTVSGVTAANKTYDGTATATVDASGSLVLGVVSGDVVSLDISSVTGTFNDKTAANGKTVTIAGLAIGGADGSNYSLTQPTTTANVIAKALSVSGITANSKTYDATATASLNTGAAALVGVVGSDTVSLSTGSAAGAFPDKSVGTARTVTISGLSISGTDATNYALTQPTTTANIIARSLTVSGITASNKTYDGTTAATVNTGSASLSGVLGGDSVTLGTGSASGAFSTKTVGTAKTVNISGLSLTGTDAANYSISAPTTTANISSATLTVTGITAADKAYDGTTTATLNLSGAALAGVFGGDVVSLNTGSAVGTFASASVGSGKTVTISGLTISGTDATNYSLTQPTTTASITGATLTVTGITAQDKTYDGTTTASANFSGATLVGVQSGDVVSLVTTGASAAFSAKTVGNALTVSISGLALSGANAANYSLTQPTTTASITAKAVTVSGLTAANRVYDATTTATLVTAGATLSGVVSGDAVTLVTSGATGAFATKTVGTAKPVTVSGLTLSGADAGNYALTTPTPTASITAAPLTVSGITAVSRPYDGTTNATLVTTSATLNGILGGDVVTLVTSGAVGTFADKNAGTAKTVTISGLTLSGADAANYSLTQPTTTANITGGPATITFSNLNQIYDGTPKSASVSVSPAGLTLSVNYSGGIIPTNAGTYTVTGSVIDPNYTGSSSATLTIAKAAQTITFPTIPSAPIGSSVTLSATASSGLPVTFSVTGGNATLSGSTLTFNDANPVVITATQSGDSNWLGTTAIQSVSASTKLAQTISFPLIPAHKTSDAAFQLTATASSGLPVTFTVLSGPALLSGSTLTLTGGSGTVSVQASQPGDATYAAATPVTNSFLVTPRGYPTIYFGSTTTATTQRVGDAEAHFATITNLAASVSFDGTSGTLAGTLPSGNQGFVVSFSINPDGSFAATTQTLGGTGATTALTINGNVNGAAIAGVIQPLGLNFSATADPANGPTAGIAGVYSASSLNSAAGTTVSIVGTEGNVFVLAVTRSAVTAGFGSVGANNTFAVQTSSSATINGTIDPVATTVTGTISSGGQTTDTFSGTAVTTLRTDRLINLSSRARVGPTDGQTLITGFVIGGSTPKRVLLRAVGPTLSGLGINSPVSNPRLALYDSTGKLMLQNDDWSGSDTTATFAQVGAFGLPIGSHDAAVVTTLSPGTYTMHVQAGAETGIALAEIYDASLNPQADYQRLINISARGTVDTGEGVLVGGFAVTGNTPKRVLIRGIGPTLSAFNVAGVLADPQLSVFSGQTVIARNDDWGTPTPINANQTAANSSDIAAAAQATGAFALPNGSKDAALIMMLAPGLYTVQVNGAGGTSGVALVEIYEIPQ